MKLRLLCQKCTLQFASVEAFFRSMHSQPLQEDNIYEFVCSNHHHNSVVLLTLRHELLFDAATHALIDGYNREAIADVASALECFYKFSIKLFLKISKVDKTSYDQLAKGVLGTLSERYLGGFVFLHIALIHKEPEFNFEDFLKYRNKVIHQGMIPLEKDVIKHASLALKFIHETQRAFLEKWPDETAALIVEEQNLIREKARHIPDAAYQCVSSVVNFAIRSKYQTFEEYLALTKEIQSLN